jgi:hypothetical protein
MGARGKKELPLFGLAINSLLSKNFFGEALLESRFTSFQSIAYFYRH